MVEAAAVHDCVIVPDHAPEIDKTNANKFRAEALAPVDKLDQYTDVKTAPHIASPGEKDWTNYAVSTNLFPGGPVRDATAGGPDARHVEYGGTFYDSYFPRYRTQFRGKDIKSDDGRLAHREVDLTYMEHGVNAGKNMDILGPDKQPLKGVTHYELNYNSQAKAWDVEFHTSDGNIHTGQSGTYGELNNINWDSPADLNRKLQGRNLLTPPVVPSPGTADWTNNPAQSARHFPGGEIENIQLQNSPEDVTHLAYKGNFKDGYLNNLIWPTSFDGYDVKDNAGNLVSRKVNTTYMNMHGVNIGKDMPEIAGPDGQPLKGVTSYQLNYDKRSGNYNVSFKLNGQDKPLTGKASWAGMENIKWDNQQNGR